MLTTRFTVAAMAFVLAAACTRPDTSHGNAAQQAPKGLEPAGGAASPVHGGADMGANPHAGMDMGGAANHGGPDPHAGMDMGGASPKIEEQDPATVIAGTIEIAPALAAKLKTGDVIFLSVRGFDGSGNVIRMPLAVDRVDFQKAGQPFLLSNQNQMVAGSNKLHGELQVTARVDRDQEAMTRLAGDIEGVLKVTPPQKDLKLVLDTEVK